VYLSQVNLGRTFYLTEFCSNNSRHPVSGVIINIPESQNSDAAKITCDTVGIIFHSFKLLEYQK